MRINKISLNDEVYAILVEADGVKKGSEWFGNPVESLQVQRMVCDGGKEFRIHWHILNPRTIKRTQEAFIVISGRLAVDVYANTHPKHDWVPQILGTLEAGPGEAILVYRGGHGVKVLEDSVVYEVKAGQFSYVSEDKEFSDV